MAFRLARLFRIPDPDWLLEHMSASLFHEWVEFLLLEAEEQGGGATVTPATVAHRGAVARGPEAMFRMMRAAFPPKRQG